MKTVVQRVTRACLAVDGAPSGEIGTGLVVLAGFGQGDTPADVAAMASKVLALRIFEDERGRMSNSLKQVKGSILVVSQFTLYGDCTRGNRPDFTGAARPEDAAPLYDRFVEMLREGCCSVVTGKFGSYMQVDIRNDGPVTILLESRRKQAPEDSGTTT